jgi:hypothetical protein
MDINQDVKTVDIKLEEKYHELSEYFINNLADEPNAKSNLL